MSNGSARHGYDPSVLADDVSPIPRGEHGGACPWIGVFDHDALKRLLNVPKGVDIIALTPLGYPASQSAFGDRGHRKGLDEVAFGEEYGARLGQASEWRVKHALRASATGASSGWHPCTRTGTSAPRHGQMFMLDSSVHRRDNRFVGRAARPTG